MIRRKIMVLAVALAATASIIGGFSSPASAFSQRVQAFRNEASPDGDPMCLDDSFGYGLRAFTCNWQSYQKWEVTTLDSGWKTFVNTNTDRCIDDSVGPGIRSLACNGLSFQNWHTLPGQYYGDTVIQNEATGRCIDWSSGYGLRAIPCNGLIYQSWYYYNY